MLDKNTPRRPTGPASVGSAETGSPTGPQPEVSTASAEEMPGCQGNRGELRDHVGFSLCEAAGYLPTRIPAQGGNPCQQGVLAKMMTTARAAGGYELKLACVTE